MLLAAAFATCGSAVLMLEQAILSVQEFNPQSLSNVLWAFASLKHHPGNALLDGSAAHAVRCVDQFTPQVCACHLELIGMLYIPSLFCCLMHQLTHLPGGRGKQLQVLFAVLCSHKSSVCRH